MCLRALELEMVVLRPKTLKFRCGAPPRTPLGLPAPDPAESQFTHSAPTPDSGLITWEGQVQSPARREQQTSGTSARRQLIGEGVHCNDSFINTIP